MLTWRRRRVARRPELVGGWQDKRRAASAARIPLDAFRADLEEADPVLVDVAEQLAVKGTPVTAVRLLELLVWCAVEPTGYYRQFPPYGSVQAGSSG